MRKPAALPLERLPRLISQVYALITLAAHHWFKAMFQKNMVQG